LNNEGRFIQIEDGNKGGKEEELSGHYLSKERHRGEAKGKVRHGLGKSEFVDEKMNSFCTPFQERIKKTKKNNGGRRKVEVSHLPRLSFH